MLLIAATNCSLVIPQTAVLFSGENCDSEKASIASVEFISVNPKDNKNNYVKEYNDIIIKYVEEKIEKSNTVKSKSQNQANLKLYLTVASDFNFVLDFITFLTLYIIPYASDSNYTLSGKLVYEDGKEIDLRTASIKMKTIRFFPLFIVDAIDNNRDMPGRTHRILIDSFLERNLLVCKQVDI